MGLCVDLQPTEGECDPARNGVRPIRRLVDGVGPVGFFRRDSFGTAAVQLRSIERNVLAHSVVEIVNGVGQHRRLDADLARQLVDRIRFDGMGKLVVAFVEQALRLLIEDLVRHRAGLPEHRPTGLGVSVGMARFAFIEKSLAQRIDRNAVSITVAVRLVADLDVRKSRVDRRGVGALPMPGGLCAEIDRHHQHFAGVMLTAAHFHQIGILTEITRAFFCARLKAAGAKNQRMGLNLILFIGIGHSYAVDAPVVAEERRDARFVAQLDAHAARDFTPLHKLADAAFDAAGRMNDHTRLKVVAPIDDHVAVDVPFDADLAHPVNRRSGLPHQDVGQFLVDPAARDALQVGVELLRRVGRNVQLCKGLVVDVRQELADLLGTGKHPAKSGMGKTRVAAELRLRCFFQHDDFRSARLLGRNRSLEGGAATANHD